MAVQADSGEGAVFLTQHELVELTDYKQVAKQRQALVSMGIPFITTPTGKLRVRQEAVDQVTLLRQPIKKQTEPDELALMRYQKHGQNQTA